MNSTQNSELKNPRQVHRARQGPAFWFAAILAILTLMPGCDRKPKQQAPAKPADQGSETIAQTGMISAEPNPVPAGPGKGKTKIHWSVDEGTARVYLSIDAGKETLFSGKTGEEAPWIEEGHDYEFHLYAGEDHKTRLATVKVTRAKP